MFEKSREDLLVVISYGCVGLPLLEYGFSALPQGAITIGSSIEGIASGDGVEIPVAQFQCYGLGQEISNPQSLCNFFNLI
jgi:hypothetical protein